MSMWIYVHYIWTSKTVYHLYIKFKLELWVTSLSDTPHFKLELWVTSLSDTPRLQYYDVQTLEYRYISKLPMKNERIWSYVKETTSHLQNKLTKNIHLGVATRSSTKWDCLKPIRFHQYTWGLQHFLTFLQEDTGHIKCYWFKISLHQLPNFWQEPYSFMHICRQCITTV